jgi:hypothetical protein
MHRRMVQSPFDIKKIILVMFSLARQQNNPAAEIV